MASKKPNIKLTGFLFICYLLSLIGTPHYLTRYLNQFISHGRLGVSIMMRSFCIPWRQIKKPPLRVAQKIGGTGIPLISRNLAQRCVAPEFSTSIFLHRHCTTSSSFCKSMWTSFLIFAIRFSPFFAFRILKCISVWSPSFLGKEKAPWKVLEFGDHTTNEFVGLFFCYFIEVDVVTY